MRILSNSLSAALGLLVLASAASAQLAPLSNYWQRFDRGLTLGSNAFTNAAGTLRRDPAGFRPQASDGTNWYPVDSTAYGTETNTAYRGDWGAGVSNLAASAYSLAYGIATTNEPLWTAASNSVLYVGDIAETAYGTETNTAYRGDWGASASNLAAQAAGWGDHALAGYLTAETDPVFSASDAYGITAVMLGNWDSAYGWGDHSTEGYLTSETDPVFAASDAAAVTAVKIGNWDTAYGWGDHAAAGYLPASATNALAVGSFALGTNAAVSNWPTQDLSGYATGTPVYVESDPIFSATNTWLVRTNDSAYTATVAKAASAVQDGDSIAALTVTNLTANGGLTILGRDVKGRNAVSVGVYGAAFGSGTSAGYAGFAAGAGTSAGNYGFAAGQGTTAGTAGFAAGASTSAGTSGFAAGAYTSAGEYGFAAGYGTSAGTAGFAAGAGTSAGYAGFAAGRAAKGADGSFVFADNSTGGTSFNRTNYPNSFSLRAAGGIYAEIGTNVFAVSNAVTMNGVELGAGGGSGISAAESGQIATNVATSYGFAPTSSVQSIATAIVASNATTAAQAGQIATDVSAVAVAPLYLGSWPCVEVAVTAANSTVSLSTSNKAYRVKVTAPGTITNWEMHGVSTAALDWCGVVLEPGAAADFSWKGLRTNVALPAAYSTNVYFPWRGPGSGYWTVD